LLLTLIAEATDRRIRVPADLNSLHQGLCSASLIAAKGYWWIEFDGR